MTKPRSARKIKRERISGPGGSYLTARLFGDPALMEGGWTMRWMTTRELQGMYDRAIEQSYDTRVDDEHRCGGCRWYGAINADWGICGHPISERALHIMFEHGGCPEQSEIER